MKLANYRENAPTAMRDSYSDTITRLGEENENVMVLDVDCGKSMASGKFMKEHPNQYLNLGIQEANAVGVAAGLSAEGQIPFMNAFGVFATRRAFDQAFLSCGYADLNVKIIGWDSGVNAEMNGGTHMPFEDVGLMRGIPNFTVIEPADPVAMVAVLEQSAAMYGNVYIRSSRKNVPAIYYEGTEMTIGKANVLREGSDVTIIAYGQMVSEALKAADELEKKGVLARVIDMFTIKPLDEDTVLAASKETGAIVVAENHRSINGLYSAVTDCTAANDPCIVEAVGVADIFGEVGRQDYLMKRFGLTSEEIVNKAMKAIDKMKRTAEG